VAGRARALAALVPALALIGCGGGADDPLDEASLRECLAEGGFAIEAVATGAPLGAASPDFRGEAAGLSVDLIVERDRDRAERSAARLRGDLATLGIPDIERRLLQERNAIAVFSADPEPEQRDAVAECLS
jgi:hypothetical protein